MGRLILYSGPAVGLYRIENFENFMLQQQHVERVTQDNCMQVWHIYEPGSTLLYTTGRSPDAFALVEFFGELNGLENLMREEHAKLLRQTPTKP